MPGGVAAPGMFDVDLFRTAGRRVVLREVDQPVVVLGSTQPAAVVDADRSRRNGVAIARRRSGGGAVLLTPGAQFWIDLWVPSTDPMWSPEPRASAAAAGEWWALGLHGPDAGARTGPTGPDHPGGLSVHRGASVPAAGSDVVCFAGLGPGEVTWNDRKVVGLAQWRSREGTLVHGCAYRRWDPEPLVDLLALPSARRGMLAATLRDAAVGLDDLGLRSWGPERLLEALPEPRTWEVLRPSG